MMHLGTISGNKSMNCTSPAFAALTNWHQLRQQIINIYLTNWQRLQQQIRLAKLNLTNWQRLQGRCHVTNDQTHLTIKDKHYFRNKDKIYPAYSWRLFGPQSRTISSLPAYIEKQYINEEINWIQKGEWSQNTIKNNTSQIKNLNVKQ